MRPLGHTQHFFLVACFSFFFPSHKRFDRGYAEIFLVIHSSLHRRHILMGVDVEHTHSQLSRRRAVTRLLSWQQNKHDDISLIPRSVALVYTTTTTVAAYIASRGLDFLRRLHNVLPIHSRVVANTERSTFTRSEVR